MRYPAVPLKPARQARGRVQELPAQGGIPAGKKKTDKAEAERGKRGNALSLGAFARERLEKKTTKPYPAYRKQKLLRMERYLFSYVGAMPVACLAMPDLTKDLKYLHDKADMGKGGAEIVGQICRCAL